MKIKQTEIRYDGRREQGKGYILYGNTENNKWITRWFPTFEDAQKFATKRNWEVVK